MKAAKLLPKTLAGFRVPDGIPMLAKPGRLAAQAYEPSQLVGKATIWNL
ncbi:MAG: hypothetical protein ACLQSR_06885 [Limisphaerales bacterium]